MGKFKDIDLTIKTIKAFPDLKKKLKKGVISTIESPAKKFVDIRTRVKKAGGYAMGGQASESVARSKIIKDQRDRKRKELLDSINRTPGGAGKSKIIPKKKPRKKKDGGEIKERIQKFKMKMNPRDFDLETGARLTEKDKTDRMRRSRDKLKSKPKRKMF